MEESKNHFESYFKNYEYAQIDLTLTRIKYALEKIHFNPLKLGRVIHIAGTNGKGTTAHFLANMLINSRYNTALFISPHIEDITERIVYNGKPIHTLEFDEYFLRFKDLIIDLKLTYFEAITLVAFAYFSSKEVDFSVIETGLGGRFDATNVIDKKLPVLTNLSYDHSNILGRNIFNIIDEKLGIVKEDNDVIFVGQNRKFINDYIRLNLHNKTIIFVEETDNNKYNYPVPYNRNYALALKIYSFITDNVYNASYLSMPACRFERIGDIILDGSHTVEGLRGILKNFKKKPDVLLTMTKDRDIKKAIVAIKNSVNHIFVTDLPDFYRSIDTHSIDIKGVDLIENPYNAFAAFKDFGSDMPKLVTGSFYLCALIRRMLVQ